MSVAISLESATCGSCFYKSVNMHVKSLSMSMPMNEQDARSNTTMEPVEAHDLERLSQRVCESVVAYVGAQLEGSVENMEVLQKIVQTIDRKHIKMQKELKSVGKLSKIIKAKARQMDEKMQCIDDIDEELTELEDMVDQLDLYTASLQTKFYEVS